jgi:hypothetical protein
VVGNENALNDRGLALNNAVNSNVVSPANTAIAETLASFVQGNHIKDWVNSPLISTINAKLHTSGGDTPFATPGLDGDISAIPYEFATALTTASAVGVGWPHFSDISSIGSVGAIENPSAWSDTVSWTPLGQTEPVDLTITEMVELMEDIAFRQQFLTGKRATKLAEIAALTTVTQVIQYDVTADWE